MPSLHPDFPLISDGKMRVYRATMVAHVIYASLSWWGDFPAADCGKLQAVLDRASCWGLCARNPHSLVDLCDQAYRAFFGAVATNLHHVLLPLLPPLRSQTHNLRHRPHPFAIPKRDKFTQLNFLRRIIV